MTNLSNHLLRWWPDVKIACVTGVGQPGAYIAILRSTVERFRVIAMDPQQCCHAVEDCRVRTLVSPHAHIANPPYRLITVTD